MTANIARIHGRLAGTGVAYRAHLKTAKSVEVARRQMTAPRGPAMVSTLKEAEIFAEAGFDDEMLYQEIPLPPSNRSLPTVQLLREPALTAFSGWRGKTDKIPY